MAAARANRLQGEIIIPHQLSLWAVTGMLGLAALLLMGMAAFMPLPRVELASGTTSPEQPVLEIIPPRPGTIEKLLVVEGEEVWPGKTLARIGTRPETDGDTASRDAIERQVAIAQDMSALDSGERAVEARRLANQLTGLMERRRSLAAQMQVQKRVVAASRRLLDAVRPVMDRGFISQLEFDRRQQDVWRAEQQLSSLGADVAAADASMAQVRLERADLPRQGKRQHMETERRTLGVTRELRDYTLAGGYDLRARTSGRVSGLNAVVGQQVDGRISLMSVVPDDAPMIADVMVPSRAIGFVRRGQTLQVRYEAFPYQRYGSFPATVEAISIVPVGAPSPQQSSREPVYRVRVRPISQTIATPGGAMPLRAGMRLTLAIILDRAPLFSILFRTGETR